MYTNVKRFPFSFEMHSCLNTNCAKVTAKICINLQYLTFNCSAASLTTVIRHTHIPLCHIAAASLHSTRAEKHHCSR